MSNKLNNRQNKKGNPISSIVESTRRVVFGIPSDEYHSTGPGDTLLLIGIIIVGFLIYVLFIK